MGNKWTFPDVVGAFAILRSVWSSQALRASFMFGVGGLGFSLGNILLARVLPVTEYAWLALIIAFSQIGMGVGPLGADTIVNRYPIQPNHALLRRIGFTSVLVAMGVSIVAYLAYGLPSALVVVLFVWCVAISVNKVASALYQSRQRFGLSLFLYQVHNGVVLVAALVAIAFRLDATIWVCVILAVGYIISAAGAWRVLLKEVPGREEKSSCDIPWRESFPIVGQGTAVILFIQLERLLVPQFLDAISLATVGVLAAIVGSPFRMMQMGIGYTMLPRLSVAKSVKERRQLVYKEAKMASLVMVATCFAIWVVAPYIVTWLLEDKYVLSPALIAAALFAGIGKVIGAFAKSAMTAVGNGKDLVWFHWMSWGAVLLATFGAYFGARWGLEGVICGISVGWFVFALAAMIMALPHFSEKMLIG